MAKVSPEDAAARVRAIFGTSATVEPITPIEPENDESDADFVDLITRVCYFYPQYTLDTAQQLTNSQVTALLIQAEKQRAIELYNHTLIAAAPHSKKGQMVGKLIKQYKKVLNL